LSPKQQQIRSFSSFFRDKEGQIVIGQSPNPPLWVAFFFFAASFVPIAIIHDVSQWGLILSLLYWSYLEIVYGVNTWRRVLGTVVGLYQVVKLLGLIGVNI